MDEYAWLLFPLYILLLAGPGVAGMACFFLGLHWLTRESAAPMTPRRRFLAWAILAVPVLTFLGYLWYFDWSRAPV